MDVFQHVGPALSRPQHAGDRHVPLDPLELPPSRQTVRIKDEIQEFAHDRVPVVILVTLMIRVINARTFVLSEGSALGTRQTRRYYSDESYSTGWSHAV